MKPARVIDRTSQPPGQDPTDAEIVGRVLAGESGLFEVLVRRYLPMIQRVLAARGVQPADVDDASQAALVQAYRKLGSLRDPARFGAFLLRIATRSLPAPRAANSLAGVEPGVEEPPVEEWAVRLETAVGRLPDRMQVVLSMKYGQGLTAAEIAGRLGMAVGSITKTLSRAYERLRSDPALSASIRWPEGTEGLT